MIASQNQTTDAAKVKQAKKAYAEYLHLLHQLGDEQKTELAQTIKKLELQKIDQIKQYIQSLNE